MSDEVYLKLVASGAPRLPGNMFYKITREGISGHCIYVQIRRDRVIGSTSMTPKKAAILNNESFKGLDKDEATRLIQDVIVTLCKRAYESLPSGQHYSVEGVIDEFTGKH